MILLLTAAHAASLDNLQIAGPWGSPGATNGAAAWWNPAGLSAGQGTRLLIEGAPTFATVRYDRAEPHGGADEIALTGVMPFAGIATDFGIPDLGVGLGLSVPFVRGGAEVDAPGSGSYHLRSGDVRAIYLTFGGGWTLLDRISIGVMGAWVHSSWTAEIDNDTLPLLNDQLEALGEIPDYTDDDLEDPDYAANLRFGDLSDDTMSFSAGVRVVAHPQVVFSLAYVHGARVVNEGKVDVVFGCPPQSDTRGRFGAESYGICNTTLEADAAIGYALPSRVHGSVTWAPRPHLAVEVMGGWVGWSAFKDYEIVISGVETYNELPKEETADLINQRRLWARDNQDSAWGGVDVKGEVGPILLGARLVYDLSAVPEQAMSPNNYDSSETVLSGVAAFKVAGPLSLGLSYTHHFVATREVDQSGFSMSVGDERAEDRWFYPHGNGTYSASIDRIGVSLRVETGYKVRVPKPDQPPEPEDVRPSQEDPEEAEEEFHSRDPDEEPSDPEPPEIPE